MKNIRKLITDYYPACFANDLMLFCRDRVEKEQISTNLPPYYKRIRVVGNSITDGWLPPLERENLFFIGLYFITLTDTAVVFSNLCQYRIIPKIVS